MRMFSLFILLGYISIAFSFRPVHKLNELLKFGNGSYNPPSSLLKAKRARYVLHNVNWGVLATLSSHYNRTGMPFTNIAAVSDGPADHSSGIPYFYITDVDISMVDVKYNNSVSFTVSENETPYCTMNNYNPEYPLCARVTLCGRMTKVTDPEEKTFALNALFSRFPEMKNWPSSHSFFPARIDIELVWILDFFGPSTVVPVKEYLAADPLK